jgi:cyanophycin synthetase
MRIVEVRRLRGPNVYCSRPVVIALIDLQEFTGRETTEVPGFTERVLQLLPGLAEHHCAALRPGGLVDKMTRGTYFGHVIEHVTLELSRLIGREVYFGRTLWAGTPGWFTLILECPQDEWPGDPVARQLLELALRLVRETATGRTPDLGPDLPRLAARYEESRLGVSTAELARAARQRDIPVRRVSDVALLQLGHGCRRRLVWAASTEQTSAVGVDIARDMEVTKQLLAAAGIPVPEGIVVHNAEEAADAFDHLGPPVVVKPLSGHHGQHTSVAHTPEEAISAHGAAGAAGGLVLVESFIGGRDYRVLIVGGQVAAAAELCPARVAGDGVSQITALVDHANAANLSTGGTSKDVTECVHPAVARMCARAAAVAGLDVCGIDLRLADISQPPAAGDAPGAVIELNSSPGLRMHLSPTQGRTRDVAGRIVDRLYPPGTSARVPIVSVTGTNGKTTTVRLIAHILRYAGLRVGMTSTDGVCLGGDLVHASDASGPRSAEMVLGDPGVQAAVLETALGGMVRRGLGYDRADVAVVTNISGDHLGTDGIDTLDDLAAVKALVAEQIARGGQLVLNADDRRCAELARRPAVVDRDPVVRYFSLLPLNQVVTDHLNRGGIAYLLEDGWLTEAEGSFRTGLAHVGDVPQSWHGQAGFMVANVLAAVAAARALGVPAGDVRDALVSFGPARDNPGRMDVFRVGQVPVVLDCARNPAALSAVGRFVRQHWNRPGVAVLTLPGDRTDALVTESAYAVGCHFDRVVVYEDVDLRGREPGEMTKLISSALAEVRPGIRCEPAADLDEAVTLGLALAGPGDPLLVVYEKLDPVRSVLGGLGAQRPPAGQG